MPLTQSDAIARAPLALDGLRSIKSYPPTLSSGKSRGSLSVDDRPTLSAPDDDPWLWLEEVEGDRALDFVERQNRLTLDKFGGAAFERDRDVLAAIYDRPDNIPYVSRSEAACSTISGRTQQPARPVAANHDGGISQAAIRTGKPCWISTSSRPRKTRTGCLSWTTSLPGNDAAHDREPVARRQRRRHLARVRPRHQELRRRWLHPAGSEERRRLGRCRHAAAFQRLWRRHGDDVRLRENRPAMATRPDVGRGAGDVREPRRIA